MCVHVYVYAYVHVCMCVYVQPCIYECMYVCISVCKYVRRHACILVCKYVSEYVRMHVTCPVSYLFVSLCACTRDTCGQGMRICMYACRYLRMYLCAYVHIYVCLCIYIHIEMQRHNALNISHLSNLLRSEYRTSCLRVAG